MNFLSSSAQLGNVWPMDSKINRINYLKGQVKFEEKQLSINDQTISFLFFAKKKKFITEKGDNTLQWTRYPLRFQNHSS